MAKFSSLLLLGLVRMAIAIPSYSSLAGLSERELKLVIRQLNPVNPNDLPPPPGPLADDSIKLVNDADHPFIAPSSTDMRGPCPGLNTLANHGYLPRNGIAAPDQLVTAVQEGYNLGNNFAKFLVYQAHLVNGNPLTNLMSIGGKTTLTGQDPPSPAIVGGLDTHGTFEGDTSMTRSDAFLGDNHSFNETLFQEFIDFSNRFGNGTYDLNAAAELRNQRLQDSIAQNPELVFVAPRILSAYSEAVFPTIFFVDGRKNDRKLTLDAARDFFDRNILPDDFNRQPAAVDFPQVEPLTQQLFQKHPFTPGVNQGVNNFVEAPNTPVLSDFCGIYEDFVMRVVKGLYPNPTGTLLQALNKNLDFFFGAVHDSHGCTQVFPFGQ